MISAFISGNWYTHRAAERPRGTGRLILTGAFAVFCVLSLMNEAFGATDDVDATWRAAVVIKPEGDGPFPVVVYLHGCAGRTPDSYRWARFLADHGFAVVLPDSMARAGRRSICDPGTRSAPRADAIYDLRVEEAQYALARVKEAPWAIPGRVFLMGHSEGGIAVASFDAAGFRGSIISGWTCAFGLFTKGPLLILNHEQDPWMAGNRSRRCGVKGEIIVPGQGHENSESPMARDASLTFLTGLVR